MNKNVTIIFAILVVILALAMGYFILQNQKLMGRLVQASPIATTVTQTLGDESPVPSTSPSPKTLTLNEVENAIQLATNQKDHSSLLPYVTTTSVNYIVMSSSCCEPKTPQEAISSLNYIDEGIPFDFSQDSTTVKTLKSKNDRLKNAYIGISKNKEHLVAFTLNDKNQIMQIEVSVSWKLYNQ